MGGMQYVASPFGASGGVKQEAELVDTAAVAGIVGVGEFRRECSRQCVCNVWQRVKHDKHHKACHL